mmetsp:Transcript_29901/g.42032  ORF Transcript_29901/g.42032 Transcript_29901/m.42032 type:complete len:263 (-) Transcript_29901:48-836(-)
MRDTTIFSELKSAQDLKQMEAQTRVITHSVQAQKDLEGFVASLQITSQPINEIVIPNSVLQIVDDIAKTGLLSYPWPLVKIVIALRAKQVFLEFTNAKNLEEEAIRFLQQLESYTNNPPFTLQRLCELILYPRIQPYKSPHKYLNALQKVVNVTTTISQLSPEDYNNQVQQQLQQKQQITQPIFQQTQFRDFSHLVEMDFAATAVMPTQVTMNHLFGNTPSENGPLNTPSNSSSTPVSSNNNNHTHDVFNTALEDSVPMELS